jgi:hypothetical protein
MRIRALIWSGIAFIVLVVSCGAHAQILNDNHVRTPSGEDLGIPTYQDINEAESRVRFIEASDVKKRQAAKLTDRYKEFLTLKNNASLSYSKLYSNRSDFGATQPAMAMSHLTDIVNSDFYKNKGVKYDERDAKQIGMLAYLVQSSSTDTCFVFNAFLGDASTFNQQIYGGVCFRVQFRTPAALEREMLVLLSHARFAKRSDSSSFTVSFEIPELK